MKRAAGRCLLALVCAVAAASAAAASRARLPLLYAGCPAGPDDPTKIAVRDAPKGPVVDYERPGTPVQETRDANLAFLSRRLFFKLKIGDELIEFQGRAGDGALDGLLSDAHGARHLSLAAAAPGGEPNCGGHR